MPSKVKGEEERESGEGKEEGNRGGGEGGMEQRVCSHTRNQCVLLCGIIHLVALLVVVIFTNVYLSPVREEKK